MKKNNELQFKMREEIKQWTNIYNQLNESLKKAGDLEHYAFYVEDEFQDIYCDITGEQRKERKANLED